MTRRTAQATGVCATCGGWGFHWAPDDVMVRCPERCPMREDGRVPSMPAAYRRRSTVATSVA